MWGDRLGREGGIAVGRHIVRRVEGLQGDQAVLPVEGDAGGSSMSPAEGHAKAWGWEWGVRAVTRVREVQGDRLCNERVEGTAWGATVTRPEDCARGSAVPWVEGTVVGHCAMGGRDCGGIPCAT